MMKRKKFTAVFLATLLALSILAGCGTGEYLTTDQPQTTATGATTAQPTESATEATEKSLLISDKPLELKIHLHYWNYLAFDDNWPVFVKAAEMTNIKLKGTASSVATNSDELFNIMIASGNDIPDIIQTQYSLERFNKYGPEGAVLPLNKLIEEHAPNIKAFLENNPDVRKYITANDGNIYYLPYCPDGAAAKGWFIRKDWLDKLNLSVPQTVDEYYGVLKAFKTKDPNGNGDPNDEIPYFSRSKQGAYELFPLFGVTVLEYEKDGKYQFDRYSEKFKVAVVNIAKWYKEGLIDPEIFTRGSKARDILLGENKGGSTHDWFASTGVYNDKLKDTVPGLEFAPMIPPADINGKTWDESARAMIGEGGWAISGKNKSSVETIKYFDFWFTEEGRRLMNFGIEGDTYTMVDGKPVFTDKVLKAEKPVNDYLWSIGAQLEIGFKQDFEYEKQWTNPVALQGVNQYMEGNYMMPVFPKLSHNEEEQKVVSSIWSGINTYINESLMEWILGTKNVEDTFDNYMNELKKMGIEDYLKAKQTAYERYLSR